MDNENQYDVMRRLNVGEYDVMRRLNVGEHAYVNEGQKFHYFIVRVSETEVIIQSMIETNLSSKVISQEEFKLVNGEWELVIL